MNKKDDKSNWVIGGTTLIGVGVGFIFLKTSGLMFVASILIGIGVGLVIAPLIAAINRSKEKSSLRLKLPGLSQEIEPQIPTLGSGRQKGTANIFLVNVFNGGGFAYQGVFVVLKIKLYLKPVINL